MAVSVSRTEAWLGLLHTTDGGKTWWMPNLAPAQIEKLTSGALLRMSSPDVFVEGWAVASCDERTGEFLIAPSFPGTLAEKPAGLWRVSRTGRELTQLSPHAVLGLSSSGSQIWVSFSVEVNGQEEVRVAVSPDCGRSFKSCPVPLPHDVGSPVLDRDRPFSLSSSTLWRGEDLCDFRLVKKLDSATSGPGALADSTVFFSPDNLHGWIPGGRDSDFILSTTDGGSTWVRHTIAPVRDLLDVRFLDELHGFGRAGADGGAIVITSEGGRSWVRARPEDLPPDSLERRIANLRTRSGCGKLQVGR
jgi:hypothetical protein